MSNLVANALSKGLREGYSQTGSLGIGSLLGDAAGALFSGAGSLAFGGGGRRIATGAMTGALIGGATSDSNTGTGTFRDAVVGGLIGAGAGAATTSTFWKGAKGAAKLPFSGAIGEYGKAVQAGKWRSTALASALGSSGRSAFNTAGRVAAAPLNFVSRHPVFSGTVGAIGLGSYSLASAPSEGMRPRDIALQQMQSQALNSNQERLQSSTAGLVQGLNARRRS